MRQILLLLAFALLLGSACQAPPIPQQAADTIVPATATPMKMKITPPSRPQMPPRDDPQYPEPPPQSLDPLAPGDALAPAQVVSDQTKLAARRIAAEHSGVTVDEALLRGIKAVEWPDLTLGCVSGTPRSDSGPVAGYFATVEIDGEVIAVHMNANGFGRVCP